TGVFFVQAEDGIRGRNVTGVQTCALPIFLMNDEVSSTSFRVSRVRLGANNFLGNDITYPAGGRTGDNVLLGTKVMVPLDGKIHEDRKSTRLNSSHVSISYAVFCLKKKKKL